MRSLQERFEDKVEHIPFSECALWVGAKSRGYGYISVGGKMVGAHRVAHELYVGPIPADMCVLHTCHNGLLGCVSPDHLRLGTQQDNIADMVDAGRQVKGEGTSKSKLSEADILEIRSRLANGSTRKGISIEYEVAVQSVDAIANGTSWKHLL